MGGLWQDNMEHRRAVNAFERAVKLDPRHASALGFIAMNYIWLRKNDSAIVWADSARKVDPVLAWARQVRGLALRERGDMGQAEREFEAALRLGRGPDQILSYAGLAEVYFRRGDRNAADTMITRAVALGDTTHPSLHDAAYLAWAFAATNQPERALRLLERYQPRRDVHFQLHLQRDPALDPLRSQPRFRALLARENVPLS
jgi:tetratricopeptide (TPR) repeat protein